MTTFTFTAVQGTSIAFNPATDTLVFNTGTAQQLSGGTNAGDFIFTLGAQSVTLLANSWDTIANKTFTFSDGSVWIVGSQFSGDTLTGGNGADLLMGSLGNDSLVGGVGNDWLVGSGDNDTLEGGTGNDTMDGGEGNDVMTGGDGADTYIVDAALDVVTETNAATTAAERDTVISSVAYTLGSNVENVTLSGTASLALTGNTLNNYLLGNSGANVLDGLAGADTLEGGQGADTYVIDSASDVITESSTLVAETDTVNSSISYTLGSNLEGLTLTGGSNINATGNSLANTLTGNAGNNILSGGTGSDTMDGGLGADTYVVDTAGDVVVESSTLVTELDTVNAAISYTLGSNLEILTLTGGSNINATGNSLANTLTGTTGNNILDGGAGIDTLIGGEGSDTYIVDSTTDVITESGTTLGNIDIVRSAVNFTLGSNIENQELTGVADINGTGNTQNNLITGNSGANILDGFSGADTMVGGLGNDIYIVNGLSDVTTETSTTVTEIDEVQSTATTFTLGANIENLTLTGSASINGTGNSLNNQITGNSGANVLNGGSGADTLTGGLGADTYEVDNAGDVIVETSTLVTEIDTVNSSISYTLGSNLEVLTLTGGTNTNATGNALANTLTGTTGNNILDGGAGIDTLVGGEGSDIYIIDNASDVITETGTTLGNIDTVKSAVTLTLSANLENLELTGASGINGMGNALDNLITGNSGANILDGSGGADTMVGGLGNDIYIVTGSSDVATETSTLLTEIDEVQSTAAGWTLGANIENLTLTGSSAINGSGNTLANLITGNSGSNLLNGGGGADTLVGGLGGDFYVVDNSADVTTEASTLAAEIDSVQSSIAWTLGANIENLSLTGSSAINGTGNTLNNTLSGNSGNNTLTGDVGADTLSGGAGVDTLDGGSGNDTYVVDTTTDTITETTLVTDIDTVNASLSYTLGTNLENLLLTGSSAINGVGNTQNNRLDGNSGNNRLDGGAGIDTLAGGTGNDTYVVDSLTDTLSETSTLTTEIDRVESSIAFDLSAISNIENLTLTATAIQATGNSLNNLLTGNASNNILTGAVGVDTLVGGTGNDTYRIMDSNDANDVLTETSTLVTEIDTVESRISFTLAANIENLDLSSGSGNLNGTGNNLQNLLTGNAGNNILEGGAGIDTLVGGVGNDIYIVDSTTDVLTEMALGGVDVIQSLVSFTLANNSNIENLSLLGASAIEASGNELDNLMTGNDEANLLSGSSGTDTLQGGIGTDTLDGGIGNDFLDGGSMDDTLFGGAGTDSLAGGADNDLLDGGDDNDTLVGGDGIDSLLGAAGNDSLMGGDGDDTMDGGTGDDTMEGGEGDDIYYVDSAADVIIETGSSEEDFVVSFIGDVAFAGVENVIQVAVGTEVIVGKSTDNTLTGNVNANLIFGLAGNDFMQGLGGDDTLVGGTDSDTMEGGDGADTYIVDSSGDSTVETNTSTAASERDTVISSESIILEANIENLTLNGSAVIGMGNELNNSILGNSAANTLDGREGADTLAGSTGNDSYFVDNAGDVVTETSTLASEIDWVNSSVSFTLGDNIEKLTLTDTANIDATGNALNNTLTGTSGNNVLDGGVGADTMTGGAGNDTYYVDNSADSVVEVSKLTTEIDKVFASLNYTLISNVEHLQLTSSGNINGMGNSLNNIITGNAGDNILNGSTGADTLIGGAGKDTYVVDSLGDVVTETSTKTSEIDNVQSSVSLTLGSNIENLALLFTGNINATGNSLNNVLAGNTGSNTLTGDAGDDTLNGGTGIDTLVGGAGNDVYMVDNASDRVTELASEGADEIQASVSYTLADNVETLVLVGGNVLNATGNALDNTLMGNAAANILDGGAGNDSMAGGGGADTYIVNAVGDVVTEAASTVVAERDTVRASISYSLSANVENLTLTGFSAIDALGNSAVNIILGNTAANILNGNGGNDILIGGAGADTYLVDKNSKVTITETTTGTTLAEYDTVESSQSFTLGANIERLDLMGAASLSGFGNALGNALNGNIAANTLDGGAGADTMTGGDGNDIYIVDNSGDLVVEASSASSEIDIVKSLVAYTLTANVEKLVLTGIAAINGTGNALDNNLTGNAKANTLDGGLGADTLIGGGGADIYIVDNVGDVIIEGTGFSDRDTVQTSVTLSAALGANIENLTLTGDSAIDGLGNSLANVITGTTAANILNGGAGVDTLIGGTGNDTYVVDYADVITETSTVLTEMDTVISSATRTLGSNLENLVLNGSGIINGTGNALNNTITGNGAANKLDGMGGNDTLVGGLGSDTYVIDSVGDVIQETSTIASEKDTVQSSLVSTTLGDNLENLTLTGSAVTGIGNHLKNTITGNSLANTLDGGEGIDTLVGGLGNDTYKVDVSGDVVTESSAIATEIDVVQSTATKYTLAGNIENLMLMGTDNISGTGNGLNNLITGNSGNNLLTGGLGIDTLTGGDGNDIYLIDVITDVVVETSTTSDQIDTVRAALSYTLGANVENLELLGTATVNATGNALANKLTGNAANNTLNGMVGADTMTGGSGSDTYFVDNVADSVIEQSTAVADIDTVRSSIESYTLTANVEKLILDDGALNGTGNILNNTLLGNTADNILDGGAGVDTMTGGLGNDTYVVSTATDSIVETSTLVSEIDTVEASITYTLSNVNLENLTLTGTLAINATGNAKANVLVGNSGNNVINGQVGADTLRGLGGDDTYIVDNVGDTIDETFAGSGGRDTVQSTANINMLLQAVNVENLVLLGTAISGTGNASANNITGNVSNNILSGGAGEDTLVGGAGADTLTGDAGADQFVLSYALATDIINDFTKGSDDVVISRTGIAVGDDATVDGALTRSAAGGFSSANELVIFTANISGLLTTSTAAAAIGSSSDALVTGSKKLFVVDNGTSSAVYLFTSSNGDTVVSAGELKLLATMADVNNSGTGDYLFMA